MTNKDKKVREVDKEEALKMRLLRGDGWTLQKIADKFDRAIGCVQRIVTFKTHIY